MSSSKLMLTQEFSFEENFSFWKNVFLITVFFVITPVTLGISLYSLYSMSDLNKETPINISSNYSKSGVKIFAALPDSSPSISGNADVSDARPEIVRQYLNKYNSPMEPLANHLVQIADKYNLDFRLLVAIAQQESNLCKIIPPETYNCWGWGIHSAGTLGFNSYEEGIETVAKGLRENYLDKGYTTPDEIMKKYTPSSNGSWAFGVNQFMGEMQ